MAQSPLTPGCADSDEHKTPAFSVLHFGEVKNFKRAVIDYLRPDHGIEATNEPKKSAGFVPFIQERNYLGQLLSVPKKEDLLPRKMTSTGRSQSTKKSIIPYKIIEEVNVDHDFNFDTFKEVIVVKEIVPKILVHRKIKPLDLSKGKRSLSKAFMSPGRDHNIREDESPGVGYYDVTDELLHPNTLKVKFSRGKKSTSVLRNETPRPYIDVMRAYEKAHNVRSPIPDFTKQTDRDRHYLTAIYGGSLSARRPQSNMDGTFGGLTSRANYYKPAVNDVDARKKKSELDFSGKSMPLNIPTLNEKFKVMKKKYDLYTGPKLK